eukprot:7421926-Pyramimonas_sp.AAC.1
MRLGRYAHPPAKAETPHQSQHPAGPMSGLPGVGPHGEVSWGGESLVEVQSAATLTSGTASSS